MKKRRSHLFPETKRLLIPDQGKRVSFFLLMDSLIIILSLYCSFLIYFDLSKAISYRLLLADVLLYFISIKLICFGLFKVYRITWRYFGIIDLFDILFALVISEIILAFISYAPMLPLVGHFMPSELPLRGFPKSIFFMDFTISLIMILFLRISKRFYLEVIRESKPARRGKRTLILGAGNTGEMILRDMARQSFAGFYPVGFLDDDTAKAGAYIHGVKVLGTVDALGEIIPKYTVEAVIIAIPSLDHLALSRLYNSAKQLNVQTIKIVPRIYDCSSPGINLKTLEDISIEDLIGRQSITVDHQEISSFLKGRVVLVTGAGGSIGSEIAVQTCSFEPSKLILLDVDETELHNLGLKLHRLFPESDETIHFIAGDIRDRIRVEEVFSEYAPDVVFHAAAYKHVPMMEYNPKEAVKVNIFGTYALAKAAHENHVAKFVMISTDKAVRPTSVMGATKRIAEYICGAFNTCSETQYVSVRFGNVLGSRGSVLPLFLDQLKYGGPITITHPQMKRYFMTIPEAVSLVLQAAVLANGGEVLVLDMGNPVRITDIAEELIRIHGLEPYKDVDIQFVGLRPGEKLFEEILTAEEGTDASKHEKIYIARNGRAYTLDQIHAILKEFNRFLLEPTIGNSNDIRGMLKKYVKHYNDADTVESYGKDSSAKCNRVGRQASFER
jgi:FlaA1/EpsC-like NDP-sugar epimerase